jgi:hypothetical protein
MKISTAVKRQLAAAAVIGMAATTAEAVVTNVDLFNTTTAAITVNSGSGPATNTTAGPDILGGDREMILQLVSVTTPGNGSFAEVQGANGLLDFSQQATSQAVLTLQYDGVQNPADTTLQLGLGSVNFANGPENFLSVTIGSSESGASLLFSIYSNALGNKSTATLNIVAPINAPTDFLIPYASFVGGATFTDVDALTVQISGPPSLDITLDAITTSVPEPSTALAALGIFGAVGTTLRRRTRQVAATA